ncbi:glycoside hydrolase family 43 protein [Listeria booriae]|uniref:glycoside hydrolase family 43 protein n=1 Tax=Listeria booriae TaxID=1552123 RepID=UPI0016259E25|nr:glycoside hydrolase family 43 protein [Listeria booriae]MBC2195143.1 glycoside hydrolase family 43 protein [Listeria booriae]
MQIENPVLTGFNADPSIIRVEDTYYIANSTFEWFPGVQIHESTDLVHWQLIGHPLSTTTLLDMKGNKDSGGIWAPDLSYADGKFWLVYTDVKITEGAFKDATNYLTTAEDIRGPWTDPIKLNGVGFDASLFHDDDGKKYLVQMEWDHREYRHPFNGIKLTEYSAEEERLLPKTGRIIYHGTDVKLVEGPHIYKLFGYYYLFCAEGGTLFSHQEVVARSKTLFGPYETQPGEVFLTAFDSPDCYLQKTGHGALVETPAGEWYFAHLTGRPWHHDTESSHDPRGWCTLGRETAIQKVTWDGDNWPHIVGGKQGSRFVDAPKDAVSQVYPLTYDEKDDFDAASLNINFNTLRVPFDEKMGSLSANPGHLRLIGKGSLANEHELSLVARRWQAFHFEAETAVKYEPTTFQQMAGLVNYYNSQHWSMIHVTWNEINGRVIEVTQNDCGNLTSFLKEEAISVPDSAEYVYFKVRVEKSHYVYAYSFDSENWQDIKPKLDAKILSDDYVVQSYGGFFTGAFVGMASVDYSGYDLPADFDYFAYKEK